MRVIEENAKVYASMGSIATGGKKPYPTIHEKVKYWVKQDPLTRKNFTKQ